MPMSGIFSHPKKHSYSSLVSLPLRAASNSEESRRISTPDDGNRKRRRDQVGVYTSGDGEGRDEHDDQ